jgi:hypothetical protein
VCVCVRLAEDMDRRVICTMTLTAAAAAEFKAAIDDMYYFQLVIGTLAPLGHFPRTRARASASTNTRLSLCMSADDLPLGGFVGATETQDGNKRAYYLYNTFDFAIEYNDDNVRSQLRRSPHTHRHTHTKMVAVLRLLRDGRRGRLCGPI